MAKVTIVIEDGEELVEIATDFQPELPEDLGPQDVDRLTPAQLFALQLLGSLEEDEYEEEDEDDDEDEGQA